ncbi:hypothetical protein B0T19DRAFT_473763 [Cercophora scortea]|uniref:Nudix hydrolase domain-containing protein n=1 Tax=Cercophora scortea TaxID=314031 RepID=A0AAE0MIK9_9PEZI|nr:hypothetical protein B0T19DRAFT_473763 [Cercophora scortea]
MFRTISRYTVRGRSALSLPFRQSQSLTMSSSPSITPLKKRAVVSSFIFKYDENGNNPQVALFRRSDKVSTYQHHLAPISGSIDQTDASPLAAAWREIHEETTLTPSSLTLLRQGKSYVFSDPSIGREWTIHPFMFQLRNPAADQKKLTIDWEHDSWAWYDPSTVQDTEAFGGVPRLAESLRRVWFERDLGAAAGKVLADGLAKLRTDYTSGARQLAGEALVILRDVVAALDAPSGTDIYAANVKWWANVRFAAWHIWKNGRESMGAAIMNALLSALTKISTLVSPPLLSVNSSLEANAIACIDANIASRDASAGLIAKAFRLYLTKTFPAKLDREPDAPPLAILTLSSSSTILSALTHLSLTSSFALDIRVLESRPLCEGVSLAAALARTFGPQHKITLYTDASVALASQGVDVVVIGADRIAESGAVSNKTGSLAALLAARFVTSTGGEEGRAKVVVLSEAEKIAGPGRAEEHVVEELDPGMVMAGWEGDAAAEVRSLVGRPDRERAKLEVKNVSFEWCPAELVDVYLTEDGEWGREYAAAVSRRVGEEEGMFFGSL